MAEIETTSKDVSSAWEEISTTLEKKFLDLQNNNGLCTSVISDIRNIKNAVNDLDALIHVVQLHIDKKEQNRAKNKMLMDAAILAVPINLSVLALIKPNEASTLLALDILPSLILSVIAVILYLVLCLALNRTNAKNALIFYRFVLRILTDGKGQPSHLSSNLKNS